MQLERILVALKPWERALPLAAEHARQLTQRRGAQLRLLTTVFDPAIAYARERGDTGAVAMERRAVGVARIGLERLAKTWRDEGAPVTTGVVWGVPAYDAILGAARDWRADLLVVGAHEPQSAHVRFTDTDWQLMRRTPCPLLLVKRAAFGGYERIFAVGDAGASAMADTDDCVVAAGRCFAGVFRSTLTVVDAQAAAEYGRAADGNASLLVMRAGPAADAGAPAATAVNAARCDVLLVPAAVGEGRRAARRSQIG